jgi:long-chain acyl-CoA synthetase
MLLHNYLIQSAERFPNKEAIIHARKRSTYEDILVDATAIANWLIDAGIKQSDRVSILMDDPNEYVRSYFGILMAGGIVVALNPQTSARALRYLFNKCEVKVVLTQRKFIKYFQELSGSIPSVSNVAVYGWKPGVIENPTFDCSSYEEVLDSWSGAPFSLPDVSPDDIAQLIYTSGTTGQANAVMLSHTNLSANTDSIVQYLSLTDRDRVMAVLPFFYSYGNSLLLTHFAVGGSLVVDQSFLYPNVILDKMVQEEVSGFSGVPSTFAILLNHSAIKRYKFPHLRYVTQAGGAMSPKLAHELSVILPNVDICIMYGQTEASARLSYLEPKELFRKAGSIGKAIPGVTLQVLAPDGAPVKPGEIGEIVATGENIMKGYWGEPESTAHVLRKEGLWTGDLARIDDEGFLYIVSRKSDMIKSGAHRISPKEIEEVILEHNSVHEVAVIGVADDVLGEAIAAYVVLKHGFVCNKKELLVHCHKNLPLYKTPQHVEFVDRLPKTASGKVIKHLMKQRKQSLIANREL